MPISIGPGGKFYATGGAKTLPRNLVRDETVLEDFENIGDWTATAGSVTANTGEYKTGTKALTVTSPVGNIGTATRTVAWNLTGTWQQFRYWAYLHNALTDYNSSMSQAVQFASDANSNSPYRYWENMANQQNTSWRPQICPKNYAYVPYGSPNWNTIRLQLWARAATSKTVAVTFDNLRMVKAVPAVMIRFDDGYRSQYDAYTYMRRYNMRGTLFQIASWVSSVDPSRLSSVHLHEIQAGGWTVGNHTQTHPDLTTLSQAQQESEIAQCRDNLAALGIVGANYYVAYPQGRNNAATVAAMAAQSMRLGWPTLNQSYMDGDTRWPAMGLPWTNPYNEIGLCPTSNTTTIATLQGYVDAAIDGGMVFAPLFHDVGGASDVSTATFRAFIDYVAGKARQGLLSVITFDDYYRLSLGSVTVPEVI